MKAARQARGLHGINAETSVGGCSVTERKNPRLPTSPLVAAGKCPDGVKELMVGVGLPMWRLSAARDDHGRAVLGRHPIGANRDGGGEVHQQRHRADHARAVVDEPDELPKIGLAA